MYNSPSFRRIHCHGVLHFVLTEVATEKGKAEVSRPIPIRSMYGIFTYIWFIFMVNVAKYTIHGSYEIVQATPGVSDGTWS